MRFCATLIERVYPHFGRVSNRIEIEIDYLLNNKVVVTAPAIEPKQPKINIMMQPVVPSQAKTPRALGNGAAVATISSSGPTALSEYLGGWHTS
jgi:hypothetical protein